MASKLPAYATKVPRPERFGGEPRRRRRKGHSSVTWEISHEVVGATYVDETWMAVSDGRPLHWLRIQTQAGSVSFNDPLDPVALAYAAVDFLARHRTKEQS